MISVIIKLFLLLLTPLLLAVAFVTLTPRILSIDDIKDCEGPQQSRGVCQSADAIVAISGGDTAARALEAIKLYRNGWAPVIIFSGAAQDKQGASNAEAMAQIAYKMRVPSEAILLDEESVNTAENATQVRNIVQEHNFKRIILVTSPYHQRRADIEFKRNLGDVTTIINHPTPSDRFWPGDSSWWTTPGGLWLGISELIKVIVVSVTHG